MKVSDLQRALEIIHVPKEMYSIMKGGLPKEALCIVNEGGWQVYYSERGRKSGLKYFETEDDACDYMFHELKAYGTKPS